MDMYESCLIEVRERVYNEEKSVVTEAKVVSRCPPELTDSLRRINTLRISEKVIVLSFIC